MKRTVSLILTGAVALGVLAGCGGGAKPQQAYDKQTPPVAPKATAKLKIAQLPTVDGLPFWVADQKGYFKNAGLDVELITFNSPNERDAAIISGDVDGMLTDPQGTSTLIATGTKVKITSLGLGATQEEGPFGIVASRKSNINSIEDLKGVEIGISNNSIIHYVTEKLLLENGFKPEEIKLTNIPQIPLRQQLLESGDLKAAVLPDPLLSLSIKEGDKLILTDAKAKQNYTHSVIIFREDVIKEQSDALKTFFAAYNLGVLDLQANPDAYMDLLITKGKLPAEVKDAYKIVPPSFAQAPKKEDLEMVQQWLVEKKIITTPLTYEQLVDDSMLPKK
jgi:NitT/TauT family transport system substrate-binding protein